jgi:septum formation protein
VLASESRSRRRALDILGIDYETCSSCIDEKSIRDPDPASLTRKLAEAKAWKIAEQFPGAVVVAAAKEGKLFEKPRSNEEAGEFLRTFRLPFQFVTSLVVLRSDTQKLLSTVEARRSDFAS